MVGSGDHCYFLGKYKTIVVGFLIASCNNDETKLNETRSQLWSVHFETKSSLFNFEGINKLDRDNSSGGIAGQQRGISGLRLSPAERLSYFSGGEKRRPEIRLHALANFIICLPPEKPRAFRSVFNKQLSKPFTIPTAHTLAYTIIFSWTTVFQIKFPASLSFMFFFEFEHYLLSTGEIPGGGEVLLYMG